MQKHKVLILGATGMAGVMIEKVLSADPSIQLGVSIRGHKDDYVGKGINIHEFDVLKDSPHFAKDYDYIINCLGSIPTAKNTTYEKLKINALFPHELSRNCKNSKIINLTTDCVFDLFQPIYENNEFWADCRRDDYAMTKYLGEVSAPNIMNLRCSIIGPEKYSNRSFFERFLEDNSPKGWGNVSWNGITTYNLAQIIKGIIVHGLFRPGLQHVTSKSPVTRYEMMRVLNEFSWGVPKKDIVEIKSSNDIHRILTTVDQVENLVLWKGAGYSSPLDFISMAAELNKIYWRWFAKDRGFVLGEGEY